MVDLRVNQRAEAVVLEQIVKVFLSGFIRDAARETLRAGVLARKRAEDEV